MKKTQVKYDGCRITLHQAKVLERLERDILLHDSHSSTREFPDEKYEYKKFEIRGGYKHRNGKQTIFLITQVGLIGDEHTLASCLARTHRMFKIGTCGGVESLIGKRKRGYSASLIHGYEY